MHRLGSDDLVERGAEEDVVPAVDLRLVRQPPPSLLVQVLMLVVVVMMISIGSCGGSGPGAAALKMTTLYDGIALKEQSSSDVVGPGAAAASAEDAGDAFEHCAL